MYCYSIVGCGLTVSPSDCLWRWALWLNDTANVSEWIGSASGNTILQLSTPTPSLYPLKLLRQTDGGTDGQMNCAAWTIRSDKNWWTFNITWGRLSLKNSGHFGNFEVICGQLADKHVSVVRKVCVESSRDFHLLFLVHVCMRAV